MPDRQEIVANSEPGQSKSGNTEVEGDTKETSQELPPPAARILKETEKLLQKGIALYKAGEDEEAADVLSDVLEARTQHFHSFAIECAAPHYYYGVALHQHVKATQDVFGCSSMDKGLEIGKDKSSERIGPVSSKETEDNQDDALARAWESIEVAKLCYENDGPEKHRDALADVYGSLADICIETGRYVAGKEELCRAIDILQSASNPSCRKLCDLHFRCSLAEEHAENYKEAKEQCGRALQFMKQEIDSKGSKLNKDCNQQQDELEGILRDLEERMTELDDAISSKNDMQKMVRDLFAGGLRTVKDSSARDEPPKTGPNMKDTGQAQGSENQAGGGTGEEQPENEPEEITVIPRPKRAKRS